VPDWHREILDERLKDLEADPHAGDSWEVVQERAHPRPGPSVRRVVAMIVLLMMLIAPLAVI